MMRDVLTAIVLLVAAVIMSACAPGNIIPPPEGENATLTLEGTRWVLVEMNGTSPIAGSEITLEFNEGVLGGNASCNSYGGDYVAGPGGNLQVGDVFRTLMACIEPPGLMEQEDAYLDALDQADSYIIEADRLIIMNAAGASILIFDRA